jgi:hypothetical protein
MSPTIGADVPEKLQERIDQQQVGDESRSATVRRLLRRRLDRIEPEPRLVRVGYALRGVSAACLFLWIASHLPTVDAVLYVGLVCLILSLTIRVYHGPPLITSIRRWAESLKG